MSTGRMRKVDVALRQVLGEAITQELKDPRVGFVTVTEVRASQDLSHARVLVTVLGGESSREATLAGLASAHGYLQKRIAAELRLKRTPTLEFAYDDTEDRAARIEELLAEGEEETGEETSAPRPESSA
jgi:ribosome-binding factor A